MIRRFQIEIVNTPGHNAERSTTDDDQEEEECRTAAHWKALVIIAESDWDDK